MPDVRRCSDGRRQRTPLQRLSLVLCDPVERRPYSFAAPGSAPRETIRLRRIRCPAAKRLSPLDLTISVRRKSSCRLAEILKPMAPKRRCRGCDAEAVMDPATSVVMVLLWCSPGILSCRPSPVGRLKPSIRGPRIVRRALRDLLATAKAASRIAGGPCQAIGSAAAVIRWWIRRAEDC
jgi:hypothetical protein